MRHRLLLRAMRIEGHHREQRAGTYRLGVVTVAGRQKPGLIVAHHQLQLIAKILAVVEIRVPQHLGRDAEQRILVQQTGLQAQTGLQRSDVSRGITAGECRLRYHVPGMHALCNRQLGVVGELVGLLHHFRRRFSMGT